MVVRSAALSMVVSCLLLGIGHAQQMPLPQCPPNDTRVAVPRWESVATPDPVELDGSSRRVFRVPIPLPRYEGGLFHFRVWLDGLDKPACSALNAGASSTDEPVQPGGIALVWQADASGPLSGMISMNTDGPFVTRDGRCLLDGLFVVQSETPPIAEPSGDDPREVVDHFVHEEGLEADHPAVFDLHEACSLMPVATQDLVESGAYCRPVQEG